MDQMKSGDIIDVAKVTRNLMLLDRRKGLSSGDKKMLMTVKNFLISEMMLIDGKEKEEACKIIETTVAM